MAGGRIGVGLALLTAVGCASPQPKFPPPPPLVEEFVEPPNEARFNQPPEQGYRRPPVKKDFRPGPNGSMPAMGGMGANGPAGMSR